MTIDQLIEHLEAYRDALGGDAEVRLMIQEEWPFENALAGVVSGEEINDVSDDDQDHDDDVENDDVVYLIEGAQLGYGSQRAWMLTT